MNPADFIKKIVPHLTVQDFKQLNVSKQSLIELLKGYGYPTSSLDKITDDNWEELHNLLIDSCL